MPVLGDQAVVGDGEQPRPERELVALEATEAAHDGQEHLADEVLGVGRAVAARVAEHPRRVRPVQRLVRAPVALAGGLHDLWEVRNGHDVPFAGFAPLTVRTNAPFWYGPIDLV